MLQMSVFLTQLCAIFQHSLENFNTGIWTSKDPPVWVINVSIWKCLSISFSISNQVGALWAVRLIFHCCASENAQWCQSNLDTESPLLFLMEYNYKIFSLWFFCCIIIYSSSNLPICAVGTIPHHYWLQKFHRHFAFLLVTFLSYLFSPCHSLFLTSGVEIVLLGYRIWIIYFYYPHSISKCTVII